MGLFDIPMWQQTPQQVAASRDTRYKALADQYSISPEQIQANKNAYAQTVTPLKFTFKNHGNTTPQAAGFPTMVAPTSPTTSGVPTAPVVSPPMVAPVDKPFAPRTSGSMSWVDDKGNTQTRTIPFSSNAISEANRLKEAATQNINRAMYEPMERAERYKALALEDYDREMREYNNQVQSQRDFEANIGWAMNNPNAPQAAGILAQAQLGRKVGMMPTRPVGLGDRFMAIENGIYGNQEKQLKNYGAVEELRMLPAALQAKLAGQRATTAKTTAETTAIPELTKQKNAEVVNNYIKAQADMATAQAKRSGMSEVQLKAAEGAIEAWKNTADAKQRNQMAESIAKLYQVALPKTPEA